jgi:hypothetical protein
MKMDILLKKATINATRQHVSFTMFICISNNK